MPFIAGEMRASVKDIPPSAPLSSGGPPISLSIKEPPASHSAAATKGSDAVCEPEIFRMEDAEATVETLLLMEFADLGTLDQTVTSGKLRGDMVRARTSIVQMSNLQGDAEHGCGELQSSLDTMCLFHVQVPERILALRKHPLMTVDPTGGCGKLSVVTCSQKDLIVSMIVTVVQL